MAKNGDIDRIINRSDEIRVREEKRQKREKRRGPLTVKKPHPIGAFRIWFVNYNTPVIFMGIPMLLLVPMFFIALGSTDEKTRVIALGLGGIVGAMVLYLVIHFLRTFPATYRAWHLRTDYPMKGLDELFDGIGRHFWRNDAEQWIDCAVTVKLKGDVHDAAEAFGAALTIFAAEANGAFYGASLSDQSRDPRKYWRVAGLQVSGSADGRVLFRLRKFLYGELAVVARHFGGALDTVEIVSRGGFFTVSRKGYSGDGTAS